MKPKLPNAVLLIGEKGIQFSTGSQQAALSTTFPENIFKDLEIQDRNSFKSLIDDFILKNKIPAVEIAVVLSDTVYFDQEIKAADRPEAESQAQKFAETVPFQTISLKVFQTGSVFRAIVINSDLSNTLEEIFKTHGCFISGLFPIFAFPQITSKSDLTPELVRSILKTAGSVKHLSFFSPLPTPGPTLKPSANAEERKKEVALIVVFLVLLLILVLVIIKSRLTP